MTALGNISILNILSGMDRSNTTPEGLYPGYNTYNVTGELVWYPTLGQYRRRDVDGPGHGSEALQRQIPRSARVCQHCRMLLWYHTEYNEHRCSDAKIHDILDELYLNRIGHSRYVNHGLLSAICCLLLLLNNTGLQIQTSQGLDYLSAVQYRFYHYVSHDSHVVNCSPSGVQIYSGVPPYIRTQAL